MSASDNGQPQVSLFGLAWPTMVTYFAFAALEMTDAWMAGQLGKETLAAMMSGQQLLFLLFAIGTGLFTGVNICASQAEQIKGKHCVAEYAWQGIWLSLALGALTGLFYWIAPPLFEWIGHELEVRRLETIYFRTAVLSMPFQFLSLALSNFFLAAHRPMESMRAGFIQVGANVILSWFLMFGWGEQFTGFGLIGAAWGTVLASVLGAVVLFCDFQSEWAVSNYRTNRFSFEHLKLTQILRMGVPKSVFACGDVLFWNVALVVFVGTLGAEHIAASAVIYACLMLVSVPSDGLNAALATKAGHLLAADREGLARKELRRGLQINVSIGLVAGILCLLLREPAAAAFSEDLVVQAIASGLMTLLPILVFCEAVILAFDGWLAGAGDVDWPVRMSVASSFVFVIGGGLYARIYLAEYGAAAIWSCICINRIVIALLLTARWTSGVWRKFDPVVE